jgi:hypothetical protein
MTTLGYTAFFLALLIFSVWTHTELYQRGYAKGRKDADNWWIGTEKDADEARVRIWREW